MNARRRFSSPELRTSLRAFVSNGFALNTTTDKRKRCIIRLCVSRRTKKIPSRNFLFLLSSTNKLSSRPGVLNSKKSNTQIKKERYKSKRDEILLRASQSRATTESKTSLYPQNLRASPRNARSRRMQTTTTTTTTTRRTTKIDITR